MLPVVQEETTRLRFCSRLSCCFANSLTKGSEKMRTCRQKRERESFKRRSRIRRGKGGGGQLLLAAFQMEATVIWSGKCSIYSLGIPRTSRIWKNLPESSRWQGAGSGVWPRCGIKLVIFLDLDLISNSLVFQTRQTVSETLPKHDWSFLTVDGQKLRRQVGRTVVAAEVNK